MMENEEALNSFGKLVDGIRTLVNWSLVLALALWWIVIQDLKTIHALGYDISRSDLHWFAITSFSFMNLIALEKLYRIGDQIKLVDSEYLIDGISRLTTHSWILNPFAYCGDSFLSHFIGSKGFGALVFVWWFCYSSMYSVATGSITLLGFIMLIVFFSIGITSMYTINRVETHILRRLESNDSYLHSKLAAIRPFRIVFMFLGLVAGAGFFFVTQSLLSG